MKNARTDMQKSDDRLIRSIAVFKFIKATLLIVAAIGAFTLGHGQSFMKLQRWAVEIGLEPGHHFLEQAVSKLANMDPSSYTKVGMAALAYAVLFLIEGAGLWLQKPWGEWFTVLITGSLIPLEIYEIIRRPTLSRVAVMLINIAIVGYLIARIQRRKRG